MKKLLFLFALLAMGFVLHAQDTSMNKMDNKAGKMHHKMKDCVMMKDGKMVVMKGGQTMAMDQDMTMSDGTVVTKDGTVKKSGGETLTLKDGQCVFMNGKIVDMKMKGMKKE